MLGQLILDESTLAHLRRLLKKISPDIKVEPDKIQALLESEVLKRDILDPDNIKDCKRVIKRKLGVSSSKPKISKPTPDESILVETRDDEAPSLNNIFGNE
jgi:hypothetical protein